MTMNEAEDHRLSQAVDAALDRLEHFPGYLTRLGDTHYVVHDEFSERAVSLARYLRVAVNAIRAGGYSPGYALLRCALEHHLIDHLFMRADRYVASGPVPLETYQRWYRQWQEKHPGTEDIMDMTRNEGGHVRIVRRGPHVKDSDGAIKYGRSIYYRYIEQFDPLQGPPEEQRYVVPTWEDLDTLEEEARKQQRLYGEAFKWRSICDNLELNGLYTGEHRIRLNVHYRFLSGFVHLTPESDKILQRQATSVVPILEEEREHPAWELGHLYAAALASRELSVLLEMADAEPLVGLSERNELEEVAAEARTASRHLWFPGDPPHPYDEFHRHCWEHWRREGTPTAHDVGVMEPYYRNPFDRLKNLHKAQQMGPTRYSPEFFLTAA